MVNLEKLLGALPKNKLRRRADLKIKFKLFRLIFINYLKNYFNFSLWSLSTQKKGLVFGLTLLIVSAATSVYAYTGDNIVPGNKLYPLKLAVEKIEQKITVTSSAKIANFEKISTRRLQEAIVLSKENSSSNQNDKIKKNIDEEINSHTAAINHINSLNDKKQTEVMVNRANKIDQEEINYLNKIKDYANNNKNEEIVQKVNEAQLIINQSRAKYADIDKRNSTEERLTPSINKDYISPNMENNVKIKKENRAEKKSPESTNHQDKNNSD